MGDVGVITGKLIIQLKEGDDAIIVSRVISNVIMYKFAWHTCNQNC